MNCITPHPQSSTLLSLSTDRKTSRAALRLLRSFLSSLFLLCACFCASLRVRGGGGEESVREAIPSNSVVCLFYLGAFPFAVWVLVGDVLHSSTPLLVGVGQRGGWGGGGAK